MGIFFLATLSKHGLAGVQNAGSWPSMQGLQCLVLIWDIPAIKNCSVATNRLFDANDLEMFELPGMGDNCQVWPGNAYNCPQ